MNQKTLLTRVVVKEIWGSFNKGKYWFITENCQNFASMLYHCIATHDDPEISDAERSSWRKMPKPVSHPLADISKGTLVGGASIGSRALYLGAVASIVDVAEAEGAAGAGMLAVEAFGTGASATVVGEGIAGGGAIGTAAGTTGTAAGTTGTAAGTAGTAAGTTGTAAGTTGTAAGTTGTAASTTGTAAGTTGTAASTTGTAAGTTGTAASTTGTAAGTTGTAAGTTGTAAGSTGTAAGTGTTAAGTTGTTGSTASTTSAASTKGGFLAKAGGAGGHGVLHGGLHAGMMKGAGAGAAKAAVVGGGMMHLGGAAMVACPVAGLAVVGTGLGLRYLHKNGKLDKKWLKRRQSQRDDKWTLEQQLELEERLFGQGDEEKEEFARGMEKQLQDPEPLLDPEQMAEAEEIVNEQLAEQVDSTHIGVISTTISEEPELQQESRAHRPEAGKA